MHPTVSLTVVQANNTNGIKAYSDCQRNPVLLSWAIQNTSLLKAAFLSQGGSGYIPTPHKRSLQLVPLAEEKRL